MKKKVISMSFYFIYQNRSKMALCKQCLITISYSLKTIPNILDFKKVSNKKNNQILVEILKQRSRFIPNHEFLIIVDGSRYKISIIDMDNNCVQLKQYFLHYDGKKLVPVSVRLVKIQL